MKKIKLILSLSVLLLIGACSKPYTYHERVLQGSGSFDDSEIKLRQGIDLKSKDDSTAYLEAYEKYCLSLRDYRDLSSSKEEIYSLPLGFKLLNPNGVDITNKINFVSKKHREKEIELKVFSNENGIQNTYKYDSLAKNVNKPLSSEYNVKYDTVKVEEYKKYFSISNDEFSSDGRVWYKPKTAPKNTNANGLYCYFMTVNNVPENLRFCIQYFADEWLFFKKVQFSIDGKAYEYIPSDTKTDNGNGNIWEWFDEAVTDSDMGLLNALANAKSAKMKLIGDQYYQIKNISKTQILELNRTLELYKAMGGVTTK